MPFQVYKSMILLYVAAHLIVPMGCSSISSKSSYLRPNLTAYLRSRGDSIERRTGCGAHEAEESAWAVQFISPVNLNNMQSLTSLKFAKCIFHLIRML